MDCTNKTKKTEREEWLINQGNREREEWFNHLLKGLDVALHLLGITSAQLQCRGERRLLQLQQPRAIDLVRLWKVQMSWMVRDQQAHSAQW